MKRNGNDTECSEMKAFEAWKPPVLKSKLPELTPDDGVLMTVTLTDLYQVSCNEAYNFLFGSSLGSNAGVFSFARYFPGFPGAATENIEKLSGDDYHLFRKRCYRVLTHELGHIFGLEHCIHFECLMNGQNSLTESDPIPLHLCPICLRKLEKFIGEKDNRSFNATTRYRELARFYQKHGFREESRWCLQRAKLQ